MQAVFCRASNEGGRGKGKGERGGGYAPRCFLAESEETGDKNYDSLLIACLLFASNITFRMLYFMKLKLWKEA